VAPADAPTGSPAGGPADRAAELRALVAHHFDRYHADNAPEIPDADYDLLVAELRALEAEYPQLAAPDSPSHWVGSPGRTTFDEVEHRVPMQSLDNVFDIDELRAWSERVVIICVRTARGRGSYRNHLPASALDGPVKVQLSDPNKPSSSTSCCQLASPSTGRDRPSSGPQPVEMGRRLG